MKKLINIAFLALFVLTIFSSCSLLSAGDDSSSLTITLPASKDRATISCSSYSVELKSSAAQYRQSGIAGSTIKFSNLAIGEYSVLVYGFDSSNAITAFGNAEAKVKSHENTEVSIALSKAISTWEQLENYLDANKDMESVELFIAGTLSADSKIEIENTVIIKVAQNTKIQRATSYKDPILYVKAGGYLTLYGDSASYLEFDGKNVPALSPLIQLDNGTGLSMNYCSVQNCTASTNNDSFSGSALCIEGSSSDKASVSLHNCNFKNNSSTDSGAAIYLNHTTAILNNVTFTKNSAVNGGALYLADSSASVLLPLSFSGNSASNCGGAVFINEDSSFSDKSKSSYSGNTCADPASEKGSNIYCKQSGEYLLDSAEISETDTDKGFVKSTD